MADERGALEMMGQRFTVLPCLVLIALGGALLREISDVTPTDAAPPQDIAGQYRKHRASECQTCKTDLVLALKRVPHWEDASIQKPSGKVDFQAAGWKQVLAASRELQSADPKSVLEVLKPIDEGLVAGVDEADAVVWITLRCTYALPQSLPVEFDILCPYIGEPARKAGEVSWPVDWTAGLPRLTSSYQGCGGEAHRGAKEYEAIRREYPKRDLNTVKLTGWPSEKTR